MPPEGGGGGGGFAGSEYIEIFDENLTGFTTEDISRLQGFRMFRGVKYDSVDPINQEYYWNMYFKYKYFRTRVIPAGGSGWSAFSEYLSFETAADFFLHMTTLGLDGPGVINIICYERNGLQKNFKTVRTGCRFFDMISNRDDPKSISLSQLDSFLGFGTDIIELMLNNYSYKQARQKDYSGVIRNKTKSLVSLSSASLFTFSATCYGVENGEITMGGGAPGTSWKIDRMAIIWKEAYDNAKAGLGNNLEDIESIDGGVLLTFLHPSVYIISLINNSDPNYFQFYVGPYNFDRFFLPTDDIDINNEQVQLRVSYYGNRRPNYINVDSDGSEFNNTYVFDIFDHHQIDQYGTLLSPFKKRYKTPRGLPICIDFCIIDKTTKTKSEWYPLFNIKKLKSDKFLPYVIVPKECT
jgi:hypothetical protein